MLPRLIAPRNIAPFRTPIPTPLQSPSQQSRFSVSFEAVNIPTGPRNRQLPSPELSEVARGKKRALVPEESGFVRPINHRRGKVFVENFIVRNFTTVYIAALPISRAELLQILLDPNLPKLMILLVYSSVYEYTGLPRDCALLSYELYEDAVKVFAFLKNIKFSNRAQIFVKINEKSDEFYRASKWSQVTDEFRKKYREASFLIPSIPRAKTISTPVLQGPVPAEFITETSLILLRNLPYVTIRSDLKNFISSNLNLWEKCIGLLVNLHGTALILLSRKTAAQSLRKQINNKEIRNGFPVQSQSLPTINHIWYWDQMTEDFKMKHGGVVTTPAILPNRQNSIDRDYPEPSRADDRSIDPRNRPSLLKSKFIESTESREIPKRLESKNEINDTNLEIVEASPELDSVKVEPRDESMELEIDELPRGPFVEKVWEVLEVSDSDEEW